MTTAAEALRRRARALLVLRPDAARAPAMQADKKSALPLHGVGAPALRAIANELFAELDFPGERAYADAVLALFRGATHREEWTLAVLLTKHRRGGRRFRAMTTLPIYEEMIVTAAWWDVVDDLASHAVGDLVLAHRAEGSAEMARWSRASHLWKRRTSVLHQLRYRGDTDIALLQSCIEGSIGDKDFFARKAIGWALRQYARTDPDWVRSYVDANRVRLAPLSIREAIRHLQG